MPEEKVDLQANALLTLQDAKRLLPATEKGDENLIKLMINALSDMAVNFCGRNFIQAIYTEKHDGDGTIDILVKHIPIISVSSVVEDSITIASSWYVIYTDEGIIRRINSGVWVKDIQNITVSYTAGWEQASLPSDLKYACLELLQFMWKRKDEERIGVSGLSFGDQSITLIIDEMPPHVKTVLQRYKLIIVE